MPARDDQKYGRDLRAYARSTQIRLIAGGLALILIVGVGLISILYGFEAGLFGLICILIGLGPILLIALWLLGFEKIVQRWRERE